MVFDNTVAHRKAEASALADIFSSEKWIEDLADVLSGDAGAVILEVDAQLVQLSTVLIFAVCKFGADADPSAGRKRLQRIQEQVEEHLFQLAWVRRNQRQ